MDISLWSIIAYVVAILMLSLLGKILAWPIQRLSRLIFNSLLGGIVLVVLNLLGSFIGLRIAINPLNALIVGVFGLPGVLLLIFLPILLG